MHGLADADNEKLFIYPHPLIIDREKEILCTTNRIARDMDARTSCQNIALLQAMAKATAARSASELPWRPIGYKEPHMKPRGKERQTWRAWLKRWVS
jgi:hypothetical protein